MIFVIDGDWICESGTSFADVPAQTVGPDVSYISRWLSMHYLELINTIICSCDYGATS